MLRRTVRPLLLVLALANSAGAQAPAPSTGQSDSPNISGIWVLNPSLTQRPQEVGFSHDWARAGGAGEGGRSGGGGRGRRGGGSGGGSGGGASGALPIARESADDSTRVEQLTGEVRTPPAHLTIVQKTDTISIADDQGHSRTFHPDGRLEELTIGTVALPTTARWDAGSFVVTFDVETGRQLRYAFTATANPARLLVEIRFLERGREGDVVKLTYEPPDARPGDAVSPPVSSPAAPQPAAPQPAVPATAAPAARPPVLPPGSELRGLTTIGTVVEDLTAHGAACGLDQTKIKTSVAGILASAGFKTQPYGDEESYVLISVVTSRLSDGTCVSRYDASLVAQADATFPYVKGLVSVPVQLLHQGGMAGGSPAAHASAIMDGLAKVVNSFVSQIRAAGK